MFFDDLEKKSFKLSGESIVFCSFLCTTSYAAVECNIHKIAPNVQFDKGFQITVFISGSSPIILGCHTDSRQVWYLGEILDLVRV